MKKSKKLLLSLGPLLALSSIASAQDYSFNKTTTPNSWSLDTNWTPTALTGGPDATGTWVLVGTNIAADSTLNLFNTGDAGDLTKTVGRLDIGDSNASHVFTLATGSGSGVLDFDASSGNAALNVVGQTAGNVGSNATISAPITLTDSLDVNTAASVGVTTGGTLTISGAVTGAGGINKSGLGTMLFSSGSNNFAGGLKIDAGTVTAGNNANALANTGGLTLNGGTLRSAGASIGTHNFGSLSVTANSTLKPDSTSGSGTKTQAFGTLTIGNSILSVAPSAAVAGESTGIATFTTVSLTGTNSTINVDNTLRSATATISGAITGSGSTFTKSGGGTMNVASLTSNFTDFLITGGTVNYNSSTNITAANTPFGTGTIRMSGGTALSFTPNPSSVIVANNVELLGNATINPNTGSARTTRFNGVISGAGKLTLGTVVAGTLANTNTYSGGTDIGSGTWSLLATNGLGTGVLNFTSASASTVVAQANQQIAGISNANAGIGTFAGNATGGANTRVLTLNNTAAGAGDNASFSGVIGGGTAAAQNVALTKIGTGTQILSGTNSYTGGTTVSGGTLLVNNASGSATGTGSISTGISGTLGGTGTVAASTVSIDGTLLGGDGSATTGTALKVTSSGGISLNDNSVIKLTLGAGNAHSSVDFAGNTGNVTFDNNQAFTFVNTQAGTYDNILLAVGANPGTTGGWLVTNAGFTGAFSYDGANIDLTVTAVPEPSAAILLIGGLGSLLLLRRRRA